MKGEFYAYFETRIVCSVIFPCFILRLFFRYIGLLTILTSGFTATSKNRCSNFSFYFFNLPDCDFNN